jgi:hypothetical protein
MSGNDLPPIDAIIFIPGLSGPIDQSLSGIARRIAQECERNCRTETVRFTTSLGGQERKGEVTFKPGVCTIFRNDADGKKPVIDVYEFDYREVLTRKYRQQNVLSQALSLLVSILSNFGRFIRAFGPRLRQKKVLEKLQILFATLILFSLMIYLGILGLAVYHTALQIKDLPALSQKATAKNSPVQPELTKAEEKKALPSSVPLSLPQFFVILVAVLEVFFPRIRQSFTNSAIEYICTLEYLNMDSRKAVLGGHLTDLLEHIAENRSYRHVHILAYSFGTVLALDQLYPTSWPPGPRFGQVHTFMTIGCPFDLIRLFWPNYFQSRFGLKGVPQRWLNVYAPMDVLGSNFRNDSNLAEATQTVGFLPDMELHPPIPENLPYPAGGDQQSIGFFGALTFVSLRAHAIYWETEFESESSCFSPLITRLYQGDQILG